jgi:DNA-binding MarR family transcriptional regulator
MEQNQECIDKVREFNRFYTNVIGLLDRHFLDTSFSLTEGRVLYEISHTELCTAKKIRTSIDIDEGYLSRIIDKFMERGIIRKTPASEDRRLHIILLTEKGKREFMKLNANSNQQISQLLDHLSEQQRADLADMMERIKILLTH